MELTRRNGHRLELTDAGRELVDISRESLVRLSDFEAGCADKPLTLVIGAGESLLQWSLLPQLGPIQRLHRGICIRLTSARTDDIISRLCDSRLDLGVVRESALVPPLVGRRVLKLGYSVFVARQRVPEKSATWESVLREVPVALQATGGQFHRTLEQALREQKVRLEPALCCASFTQASRAVQTGYYAAVLPSTARRDTPPNRFAEFPLPVLKDYERIICVAWNPRRASMRPAVEKFGVLLARALKG